MNNRQNGRRGRGRGGNGGIRPMGGGGQQDRGNRIDNRARGNANQLHEKYKTLARDAQMQGDRVMTEYYLQFADHYFRVLAETRGRFEDQRPQRRDFADDYDGDEGEIGDEQAADGGQQAERDPRRERDYRRDDRSQPDDRQQDGRRANGHYNGNGQDGREREPRFERRDRDERANGYQPAPQAEAAADSRPDEGSEQPRRGRGRPRRETQPEVIEAGGDRLTPPSFFGEVAATIPPPVAAPTGEETPAPRRRVRRPRPEADEVPAEV